MRPLKFLALLLYLVLAGCNKGDDAMQPNPDESMYFPSINDNDWETTSLSGLGWNEHELQPLEDYLIEKNTKPLSRKSSSAGIEWRQDLGGLEGK